MEELNYRRLVENSLGLMCVHDLEGVLAYVSPAAARALGWEADDGVGRNLRGYLAPSVEHLFDGYLDRLRREGTDSGLMLLQAKDATERIWEYRNAVVNEPGRAPYVVGHAIDVTERVRAEQALRKARRELEESYSRHRSLVEGSALGICILQQGTIRFANGRLAELHGYPAADDLLEQPFACLLATPERDRIEAHFAALLTGARVPDRLEARHVTREGRLCWMEMWNSVVVWKGALGVLVTVIDVSERKHLEEQLHRMDKVEAVGRLAGGIAHEINNLMMVVLGRGEQLRANLDAADPRRAPLDRMTRAARDAARLAADLLTYSRRLMLQPERLSLGDVVTALSSHIQASLPPAVSFGCTVDSGLWPVVADRTQLEAAILHLTDNSRDALADGGLLRVAVANIVLDDAFVEAHPGARRGPHVVVSVRDTGRGLSPEARAHLFEPFFTTKAVGEGKGLGLPSAYGIVKQHGGYIDVDSEPGRGTEVRMFFPRADQSESGARPPV